MGDSPEYREASLRSVAAWGRSAVEDGGGAARLRGWRHVDLGQAASRACEAGETLTGACIVGPYNYPIATMGWGRER